MERNCPLFRYWSMRSGFLSRRNTRSSTSGLPSTSLKSTGTLYRASPHQSSVMTMTLSFLPRRVRAVLSSGLILISERNFMNVSLLVPIWSRYCWTVIPCANRSFVSIRSPSRRLSHRGEINGELRHFLLLGVPHHQGHAALRIDGVGGKRVDALGGIASVRVAQRGALVLHKARLHRLRAREDLRGVVTRKVRFPTAQGDPEGELAFRVLEDVLHVARPEVLALEGGVASGEGEPVKGRHHDEGLPRSVLHAPLRAEFLRDDALLPGADGLLAVRIGEDYGHRLAGRRGHQSYRQGEERKAPIP